MPDKEIKFTLTMTTTLYDRLLNISQKSGFKNVNDFFLFLLDELFPSEVDEQDQIEKTIIEQKLRDLGYL